MSATLDFALPAHHTVVIELWFFPKMTGMFAGEWFRHQHRNITTQHLVSAVTEHGAGTMIEGLDTSQCINRNHPVDHVVQNGLVTQGQVTHARIGLMFIKGHLQHGMEFAVRKGLEDVTVGLGQHRPRQHLLGSKRTQEHHRQRLLRTDGLRRRNAVHGAAQLNIHQHQIGLQLCRQRDRLLCGAGLCRHTIAHALQLQSDVVCNQRFVFNQENGRRTHQKGCFSRCCDSRLNATIRPYSINGNTVIT